MVHVDEDMHGTQTAMHNVQELRQKGITTRYCVAASYIGEIMV
jgi:hypothetical protein